MPVESSDPIAYILCIRCSRVLLLLAVVGLWTAVPDHIGRASAPFDLSNRGAYAQRKSTTAPMQDRMVEGARQATDWSSSPTSIFRLAKHS